MFSTNLGLPPVDYSFALDLQVATLRTLCYHYKYLIFRSFFYKALRHPDQLSGNDALGAAACLQAGLRWPVAIAPTCTRKRLIPCLSFCTQSLLRILVALHLAQQLPVLRRTQTLCGSQDHDHGHSEHGRNHLRNEQHALRARGERDDSTVHSMAVRLARRGRGRLSRGSTS